MNVNYQLVLVGLLSAKIVVNESRQIRLAAPPSIHPFLVFNQIGKC